VLTNLLHFCQGWHWTTQSQSISGTLWLFLCWQFWKKVYKERRELQPAPHVSARLSSALLITAPALRRWNVRRSTPPMKRICSSYSLLRLIR